MDTEVGFRSEVVPKSQVQVTLLDETERTTMGNTQERRKKKYQYKHPELMLKCYQCGFVWMPKSRGNNPKICLKCKSEFWNCPDYHPPSHKYPCGHVWEKRGCGDFPRKCPECMRIRYNECKTFNRVMCLHCGHQWKTRTKKRSGTCPKCGSYEWDEPKRPMRRPPPPPTKFKIEMFHEYAQSRGGECLTTKIRHWTDKITYRCADGHLWTTTTGSLNNQTWCNTCAHMLKHHPKKEQFDTTKSICEQKLKEMKEHAKSKGGECLANKYEGCEKKVHWRCKRGHEWDAQPTSVLRANRWCPMCKWFQEDDVRQIIEKLFGVPFPKSHPTWLRNPRTNRKLELDGYNKKLKLAFEYNGPQHYLERYSDRIYGKGQIKKVKYRDKIKIKTCSEKGIKLIIIPYWVTDYKNYIFSNYPDLRMSYGVE